MANIALLGRRNMARALARGNRTIMTIRTGANYLRVIHRARRHRCPFRRRHRMARFAHIGGSDMGRALTTGLDAIVTTNTIIGNGAVIHARP